jgi:hypothetical protein
VDRCLQGIWSSSLGLESTLDDWSKFDAGSDIVNVRLEMLRNMVSAGMSAGFY